MNVKLLPLVVFCLMANWAKGQAEPFQFSPCDSILRTAMKKFVTNNFGGVIQLADSAEHCYAERNLPNGQIAALNIKVRALYQMNQLDSAFALVNRVLSMSDTLMLFPFVRMGTHFHLGTITYNNGDYEGALPHFLDAVHHYEASIDYVANEVETAEELGEDMRLVRALEEIVNEGFVLAKGYLYNYIGLCYQKLSDHNQAIGYFQMGFQMFRDAMKELEILNLYFQKIEAKMQEQICTYHIGLSYAMIEDYERSNQYIQMAIDSMEVTPYLKGHAIEGRFFESLGDNILLDKTANASPIADFRTALRTYQKASPLAFIMGGLTKEQAIAGVLTKLAIAHFSSAKDSSLYYLDQSLQLFKEVEEKALPYYQPHKATMLMRLANLYKKHGEPTAALEQYRDALMILNEGFEPTNLFENPKADEAIFEQHMIKAYRDKGLILKELAVSENNPLFLEYALESYDRAIHILDEMRKNFVRGSLSRVMKEVALTDLEFLSEQIYEEALDIAYELNQKRGPLAANYRYKAFEISEKSKAFALRSAIFRLKTFQAMPPALLERERLLKNDLFLYEQQWKKASRDGQEQLANEYQERLHQSKRKLEAFIDSLKSQEATRPFYDLQYNNEIYSIAAIRENLLNDTTAIIEYMTSSQALYGFVITKNDFQLFKVPLPPDFNQQIRQLRSLIQNPRLINPELGAQYGQLAFGLHQLLIAPTQSLLPPSTKRLKIIPHGRLHHLNFDFLIKDSLNAPQKNRPYNPRTFAYLLHDYEFSYHNSVSIMMDRKRQQRRVSQRKPLHFVGVSPDYRQTDYAPLVDELSYATQRFGPDEVTLLEGPQAGERQLRALLQNYAPQILHFNAHASLDTQDLMQSHIVLHPSADSVQDNKLRLAELYSLTMEADLVVLSACESGYSEQFRNGEGVISLARGCQYAGVKQAIMSLWPIESEATAILMEAFYEGLLDRELPPAAALRYAKRAYLDRVEGLERLSPFYWSGLVLLGGD